MSVPVPAGPGTTHAIFLPCSPLTSSALPAMERPLWRPCLLYTSFSEIVMPGEAVEPDGTPSDVIANTVLVSKQSTSFAGSSYGRAYNIKLGLQKINGKIVQPGETFSVEDALGNTTDGRIWKSAGAIENGVPTDAIGGGICQVSTTLFNAEMCIRDSTRLSEAYAVASESFHPYNQINIAIIVYPGFHCNGGGGLDRSFVCEQIYQNPQGVFRLADVTTDQQALVEAYKESADLIYLDPPFYTCLLYTSRCV